MYRKKKHKVEDRIVSISQSWVRPIVRGKANAPVEFGAKVSISMETSEPSIHLTFIVMNLAKRLRVFLLPILET